MHFFNSYRGYYPFDIIISKVFSFRKNGEYAHYIYLQLFFMFSLPAEINDFMAQSRYNRLTNEFLLHNCVVLTMKEKGLVYRFDLTKYR